MNEYLAEITLDLDCRKIPPRIAAGQYDKGRKCLIHITANNVAYSATGATAVIKGRRQDKSYFSENCTIDNSGNVVFTMSEATLAVSGFVYAKVVLSDSTQTYSTQLFIIDVDNGLEGDVIEIDSFSVFNDCLRLLAELLGVADASARLDQYVTVDDLANYVPTDRTFAGLTLSRNQSVWAVVEALISGMIAFGSTDKETTETLDTPDYHVHQLYCANGKIWGCTGMTSQSGNPPYVYTWEPLGNTQIDLSGKVDKTQTIAGIALSGNISSADLAAAIILNVNPVGVNPNTTSGTGAQFGRTSNGKPVMHTLGTTWVELALDEDVPQYLRDLIDGDTAIRKYTASSAPPTSETAEAYSVPCLWKYNNEVWYVYEDTGTGGRHLYSSILLTQVIPTNVSAFTNDAGYLTAQGITGKMDLARIRSAIDDDTQIKPGQLEVVANEAWLKTAALGATGHLVLEDKANKVTAITASPTNSQYPSALAVKNYVDTVIGGIENGSY